nr:PAS domain S-box protein [Bacteroidota bacterium]
MKRLKISKRYLLMPIVLTVFFLLFYLVYEDIKDRTLNEFNNEQLILAETASQGITSFFDDYQSDLTFLSQFNGIIDFTDDGKALMASFYENHKNLIEAITRVDSLGAILYTYPYNESVIGEDISYQKHVRQVITTRQPVISDVFMAVQGYLAIALHIPVFNEKEFMGSLAVLIPIDKVGKRYFGKMKIRGSGTVWLLSENGVEIYCPIHGHTGKSFLDITRHNSLGFELLEKIRNEYNGIVKSIHHEVSVNGKTKFIKKHMAFYRAPLGNTYWTIIISYQEKDIYIALSRLRNRLIFIFCLLFLIISYYFYSIAKVRTVLKEEAKRKKAEKTLRESEEKFRTIFKESPIGIELYNADGIQLDANKASLKMFGIPDVSDLQKFNLFDGTSLDVEKKEKLLKGEPVAYQALFDFEKVKELHQYKTHRSGKAYFDYIITPLLNADQKAIDGYLLQVRDISEHKRAEEEILMLAHALRSVNESVSITDMEDKILFVNESFSKTYGYGVDELTGQHMGIMRSTDNPSELISEILPATLMGGWRGELKNKRKDGSEFPIFLSTTIIHDKEGKPLGLIGVASDIT